jgi:hypothetical protein
MLCDVWRLGCISGAVYVFMYFDMFYIQWHHLAKKDLWNKVYMIMIIYHTVLLKTYFIISEQTIP